MSYQQLESFEARDRGARPTVFLAYFALSLCVGVALWGAIFSVSLIRGGLEPVDVASLALGFQRQIDDPMIVEHESDLFLIEPAAGPAHGCE